MERLRMKRMLLSFGIREKGIELGELIDLKEFNKGIGAPANSRGLVGAGGCSIPFGEPWVGQPSKEVVYNGKKFKTFCVGLGHQAGVGKDTLANYLIEKLGPRNPGEWGEFFPIDIRRYAFGDELKIEVFDFLQSFNFVTQKLRELDFYNDTDFPLPKLEQHSRELKLHVINSNKTILRLLLQGWGTEFRREQDPNYWVKKAMAQVEKDNPQVAIFTDMRFENEAREMDTQIHLVRIPSKELLFNDAGETTTPGRVSISQHVSETQLDSFPYPFTVVAESKKELLEKGSFLIEELLKDRNLLPR